MKSYETIRQELARAGYEVTGSGDQTGTTITGHDSRAEIRRAESGAPLRWVMVVTVPGIRKPIRSQTQLRNHALSWCLHMLNGGARDLDELLQNSAYDLW